MKMNIERFRDYIIKSLAVSMLIIFWVFCIDAYFHNMWSNFKIIISIMAFAFVLCFIQTVINLMLDNKPVISMFLEYMVVVILFFSFGMKFKWYDDGFEWLVFIYTIPVYVVGYLLKLTGTRRDAEYINRRLSERKKRKTQENDISNI